MAAVIVAEGLEGLVADGLVGGVLGVQAVMAMDVPVAMAMEALEAATVMMLTHLAVGIVQVGQSAIVPTAVLLDAYLRETMS